MSHRLVDGLDASVRTALMAILREFRLSVDPVVAGALRAVVTLDGTLRTLSRDFNMVAAARLHARSLLVDASGPRPLRTSLTWCTPSVR